MGHGDCGLCSLTLTAIVLAVGALVASCAAGPQVNLAAQRCWESATRDLDPDHGIDDCTRAIQSGQLAGKELGGAYVHRGFVWARKEDYDRALRDYDAAVRLDTRSPSAYAGRGTIWYATGNTARALADYEHAMQLQPGFAFAYKLRAFLRFDTGDVLGAVADLQLMPQTDPHALLRLYLARGRLGQDGLAALKADEARAKLLPWSKLVTEVFLGQRSPESAFAAAQNGDDRCNLQYYVGEWLLNKDIRPAAVASLRSAEETCPKPFIAYRGAVAELRRVGQP